MPPKPKFTKEEMVAASISLIEKRGASALTARELGKELGSSSCPIFTVFEDMDDLRRAVMQKAKDIFGEYMSVAEAFEPSYKMRGIQWVKFAAERPKLFEMMFMRETGVASDITDAVSALPFGLEKDIEIICRDYNATEEQAERLFGQMWIYTYGLCVITARGVCSFSEGEVARKLGEIFNGMVYVIKSVPKSVTSISPVPAGKFSPVVKPDFSDSTLPSDFIAGEKTDK